MMSAERALNTGVDAWEAQIDAVIADCRARLPQSTEAQRRECVAEIDDLDRRVIEPTIVAIVAALRVYWTATSAGDDETARDAIVRAQQLASSLPPEIFGALETLITAQLRRDGAP